MRQHRQLLILDTQLKKTKLSLFTIQSAVSISFFGNLNSQTLTLDVQLILSSIWKPEIQHINLENNSTFLFCLHHFFTIERQRKKASALTPTTEEGKPSLSHNNLRPNDPVLLPFFNFILITDNMS